MSDKKTTEKKIITQKLTEIQCCSCNKYKPTSEFYKHTSTKTGFQLSCKACNYLYCKRAKWRRRGYDDEGNIFRDTRIIDKILSISEDQQHELEKELNRIGPRSAKCKDCKQEFIANLKKTGGTPTKIFCPECIAKRVAAVLAERVEEEEEIIDDQDKNDNDF